MLESFGFASELSLPLGIITILVNDWVHLKIRHNDVIDISILQLCIGL